MQSPAAAGVSIQSVTATPNGGSGSARAQRGSAVLASPPSAHAAHARALTMGSGTGTGTGAGTGAVTPLVIRQSSLNSLSSPSSPAAAAASSLARVDRDSPVPPSPSPSSPSSPVPLSSPVSMSSVWSPRSAQKEKEKEKEKKALAVGAAGAGAGGGAGGGGGGSGSLKPRVSFGSLFSRSKKNVNGNNDKGSSEGERGGKGRLAASGANTADANAPLFKFSDQNWATPKPISRSEWTPNHARISCARCKSPFTTWSLLLLVCASMLIR